MFGGSLNNGRHCGSLYVNLNNAPSNANWNIGASVPIIMEQCIIRTIFLDPWKKLTR